LVSSRAAAARPYAMAGFALPEYVAPKMGLGMSIVGGTMPKSSADTGGMLSDVKKLAKNPGPEHYNQKCNDKVFSTAARGGTFSKLAREYPKGTAKSPAVGAYETVNPHVTPRTKGGPMPKTERGCLFFDQASLEGKWKQSPGKYDGKQMEVHQKSPTFKESHTESRNPKKANGVGPGYYALDYRHIEKKVPVYSGSHEATKSYLDQHVKGQDKMPAPGQNGIPEAKNEDRQGRHKHAHMILIDRHASPRFAGSESA